MQKRKKPFVVLFSVFFFFCYKAPISLFFLAVTSSLLVDGTNCTERLTQHISVVCLYYKLDFIFIALLTSLIMVESMLCCYEVVLKSKVTNETTVL